MAQPIRRRWLIAARLIAVATKPRVAAAVLAVAYIALIAATANGLHLFYILFPELGALAVDVFSRPYGRWAREPWKLIATPTATAVAGIAVSRYFSYGTFAVLLVLALGVAVISILRSSVAPALSAGVLPLVLGVKSWLYPPSILLGLSILTGLLLLWRRSSPARRLRFMNRSDLRAIELLEARPRRSSWLVVLFLFTTVIGIFAGYSGWRFILFPPLLVMAYEMYGHPETCAWAKPPFYFPLACFLTAVTGVLACQWIRPEPLAVMITLAVSVAVLRVFRLRMPPALSIGLLPFVMASPTLRFALSVGIGTFALTTMFLFYKWLVLPRSQLI